MARHPRYKDHPRWRWAGLVEGLGTAQHISDTLQQRGYPRVPLSTIWNWKMRNSIPTMWVPPMLQLGLEAGLISKLEDLRVKS